MVEDNFAKLVGTIFGAIGLAVIMLAGAAIGVAAWLYMVNSLELDIAKPLVGALLGGLTLAGAIGAAFVWNILTADRGRKKGDMT